MLEYARMPGMPGMPGMPASPARNAGMATMQCDDEDKERLQWCHVLCRYDEYYTSLVYYSLLFCYHCICINTTLVVYYDGLLL